MSDRIFAFLFCFAVITGCGDKSAGKVPKEVIPREKMVAIMTDIHVIEGARLGRNMMGDSLKVDDYYQKVYQKYHVSKKEFERSFTFYSEHPDMMDKIYDQVIENLNSMEVAAPKWEEEEKQDSTALQQ